MTDTGHTATRRGFLLGATGALAGAALFAAEAAAQQSKPGSENTVTLPPIDAATEPPLTTPGPFLAPGKRVGFAVVGLGNLSLDQILPAFGSSDYCRVTALVSGDRGKALKIAAQYGIPESNITDYAGYEKLKDMPGVDVIYIVLPNSMHHEFVLRGAKMGKHILCEKPMATSARECEDMIAAAKQANVKLMIAYRQQYEPMNQTLKKAVADGKLGKVRNIVASNSQAVGDPTQWRLNRKLAGGGCMPDVGVYCLNASRFLTDEEPDEVFAMTVQPKEDPRFKEVESRCEVLVKFPSGMTANFTSAYDTHRSTLLRLEGDTAWGELSPAFGYHGSKLHFMRLEDGKDVEMTPSIAEKDQFALEMDHMATCVLGNVPPHTPGEEGLQDHRLIEAIYKSAATGRSVKVQPPATSTRGPALPPMKG